MTPIAGKNGRVRVENIVLPASDFTGTVTATEIDTYNYESGGNHEFIFGRNTFEGTVTCYWDADQPPHNNPPNLRAGQFVLLEEFIDRANANRKFNVPKFGVLSVRVKGPVDGKFEIELSGKGSGTFTYPS